MSHYASITLQQQASKINTGSARIYTNIESQI